VWQSDLLMGSQAALVHSGPRRRWCGVADTECPATPQWGRRRCRSSWPGGAAWIWRLAETGGRGLTSNKRMQLADASGQRNVG